MKYSKRFVKSTLELLVGLILILDLLFIQTGIIALIATGIFAICYINIRREARIDWRHSKVIKEKMTIGNIKAIETKYTQRQDFDSPHKRAMLRSPLDRFFYHYRYQRVQALMKKFAQECNAILDLGCGFGRNTHFISFEQQKPVFGLDLDELKLYWAQSETKRRHPGQQIPFVCGDASRPPFAAGSFDCILFTEVLEHLINPAEGIDACHELLRKNGKLIITVPSSHNLRYSNNPYVILEKVISLWKDSVLPPYHNLHAQFEYNRKHPEPEYGVHYNFSRQGLEKILQNKGFRTLWRGSFELEVYPLLLIEMLYADDLKVITKYVGAIEKILTKLPIVNCLGQHLIHVALKE